MAVAGPVLPPPHPPAEWGGASALTYFSLFGTIVMMIISIVLAASELAPVLKANMARMTEEELAQARLEQLGIGAALPTSPAGSGRSVSSLNKVDRMYGKVEALEQEVALLTSHKVRVCLFVRPAACSNTHSRLRAELLAGKFSIYSTDTSTCDVISEFARVLNTA